MPPDPEILKKVKEGLVDVWAPGGVPVGALKAVLPYEPIQAPALPLLSMQLAGFNRAALATDEVQGQIKDPLGGRTWVWRLDVRIWVALRSDAKASQEAMDLLIPEVVTALEGDRSLGSIADDAALSIGDTAIVRPREGQALFVTTCRCAVETTETLS